MLKVLSSLQRVLDDVPDIFSSMTEFTASYTGTETEVADADGVVLDIVGKVVTTLGHCTNKDTDAFLRAEGFDVVTDTHDFGVEREGHFATIVRKVVGNGVLDDSEEFLLGRGRADGKSM